MPQLIQNGAIDLSNDKSIKLTPIKSNFEKASDILLQQSNESTLSKGSTIISNKFTQISPLRIFLPLQSSNQTIIQNNSSPISNTFINNNITYYCSQTQNFIQQQPSLQDSLCNKRKKVNSKIEYYYSSESD